PTPGLRRWGACDRPSGCIRDAFESKRYRRAFAHPVVSSTYSFSGTWLLRWRVRLGAAGRSHADRDLVSSRSPCCAGRPSRKGTWMGPPTRRGVGLALLTLAIGLANV